MNQIECDTKKKGERWKKEKCHAKGQKLKVKLKSAAWRLIHGERTDQSREREL